MRKGAEGGRSSLCHMRDLRQCPNCTTEHPAPGAYWLVQPVIIPFFSNPCLKYPGQIIRQTEPLPSRTQHTWGMERRAISDTGSTSIGLTCPLPHILIPAVLQLVALSGEMMHRDSWCPVLQPWGPRRTWGRPVLGNSPLQSSTDPLNIFLEKEKSINILQDLGHRDNKAWNLQVLSRHIFHL